ncbi:FlgO family outer membrane protein [Aliiglaciecola sp. LCG003]|uniref:FlgO family outer membrane protein n=1 Tax=Aliiglaciecola sp. LCG003 TaxID=3053655 RepID=UPI0025729EA8|nr:FlgO family outer membrane protein [Aliiglaciecola sp. LCG003]WJG08299.1 FlgO family outer membrane protein [Aliiglaciecola sp. LCG003]
MKMGFEIAALCILTSLLSGCASSDYSFADLFSAEEEPVVEVSEPKVNSAPSPSGLRYRADSRQMNAINRFDNESQSAITSYRSPPSLYKPAYSHKSLIDYAEQLTMELVKNGRYLTTHSRVGVASFVNLDAGLKQTSALGNQLSELMISEVQSFGVPVVDFKTTDNITVGPSGDMVFSREAAKLADNLTVDYVLSGTLIQNEKGVRVNARIIAMDSKLVVSSASIMIPHFVVQSLQPSFVQLSE